jgi:Secretion system C-terminal sorting domain/Calx-beta domain
LLTIVDTSVIENVAGGLARIRVALSAPATSAVTFTYSTAASSPVSAVAGSDYTTVPTTSGTIAIGQSSTLITVPIIDNTTGEPSETFRVALGASPTNAVLSTPSSAVVTITDNDLPLLTIIDTSVVENVVGGLARIRVALSTPATSTVTFTYSTAASSPVSAVAGSDYTTVPTTTGTIAIGQSSTLITVPIIDNTTGEPSETFQVVLGASPTIAVLGTPSSAVVTIADNDLPLLTIVDTSVVENVAGGLARIRVALSAPATSAVTFTYSTAASSPVSAVAGSDYTTVPTTSGTIAIGQSSTLITVPIIDNTTGEPSETFQVVLGASPTNAVLGTPSSAVVIITDNDTAPCTNSLVTQGGFEIANLSPTWTAVPSSGAGLTIISNTGQKAAQINATGNRFYQTIAYSTVGATTAMRAWVRGNANVVGLSIKYMNSSYVPLGTTSTQNFTASSVYTEKILTSTPAPVGTVWVEISVTWVSGSSSMYVDDICFVTNTQPLVSSPQSEHGIVNIEPLTLYPNPAKDYATLTLPENGDEQWSIQVIDRLGMIRKQLISPEVSWVTLDLFDLEPGLYFVRLASKTTRVQTLRLVVESNH